MRRKDNFYIGKQRKKNDADFSSEGKQTRKQWNDIFKGLKGKKNQPKIIFKNKSKIIFPNKQSEKISC